MTLVYRHYLGSTDILEVFWLSRQKRQHTQLERKSAPYTHTDTHTHSLSLYKFYNDLLNGQFLINSLPALGSINENDYIDRLQYTKNNQRFLKIIAVWITHSTYTRLKLMMIIRRVLVLAKNFCLHLLQNINWRFLFQGKELETMEFWSFRKIEPYF